MSTRSSTRVAPALSLLFVIGISIYVIFASDLFLGFGPTSVAGKHDLVQYWSAIRLILSGQNPYDPNLMMDLESTVISGIPLPVIMWNPPLIFPILFPFSFLDFNSMARVWFMLSLGSFCSSLYMLQKLFKSASFWGVALIASTLPAIYVSIYYGQISPILLFGLASALWLREQRKDFLSGLLLSITLLKPHLLWLYYMVIFERCVHERRLGLIYGIAVGAAVLSGIAIVFHPDIFTWYVQSFSSPPTNWKTPTLGSALQTLVPGHPNWARVLPTCIVALIALPWIIKRKKEKFYFRTELVILPLSLLSSPYGWVYDQMLLLPTLVYLSGGKDKGVLTSILLLNTIALIIPGHWGQQVFLWYTVAIFCFSVYEPRTR